MNRRPVGYEGERRADIGVEDLSQEEFEWVDFVLRTSQLAPCLAIPVKWFMQESSSMEINRGRWTASIDGDFVVFLIGAEVWDPQHGGAASDLLLAMIDMLAELEGDPTTGLLGYQVFGGLGGVIVQYWRSFEALEAYAKNPDARHAPVWRAWNRLAEGERAKGGIWHETFQVPAGHFEAVYQNMPVTGLQKAGRSMTVTEARTTARQRLDS